jgi:hypothetical protein
MQSLSFVASYFVPTLMALAISLPLAAQDGFAPTIDFSNDNLGLRLPEVVARESAVSDPFSLNNDLFTSGMQVWHLGGSYPYSTPFSGTVDTVHGISVTAISGPGTWEYWNRVGSIWVPISDVSEDSVRNIHLSEQLRFIPFSNVLNPSEATLTFRAVDDIRVSGVSTVNNDPSAEPGQYGGDPTSFSFESRTLRVPITPVNDAPAWNRGDTQIGSGGNPLSKTTSYALDSQSVKALELKVWDLVNSAQASDPDDSLTSLTTFGVLLTNCNTADFTLQRRDLSNTQWVPLSLPTGTLANGVLLGSTDILRVIPRGNLRDSTPIFEYHLWDGTGGNLPGDLILVTSEDFGGTAPFSLGHGAVKITLTANSRPQIDRAPLVAVINPGDTTAEFLVTAQDLDGQVTGFGMLDDRDQFHDGPADIHGVHFEWGDADANEKFSNTLYVTNLQWSPGPHYFSIAAKDDLGDLSSADDVTVYGNSAPIWGSDYNEFASGLRIDSRAQQPLIATFVVRDADVDTIKSDRVWNDTLTVSVSDVPLRRGSVNVSIIHISDQVPAAESAVSSAIIATTSSTGYSQVTLTYTPDTTALVNYHDEFTITVTDANGLTASLPTQVAVDVHHPPVITSPTQTALGTVYGGTAYPLTLSATDDNSAALTWTVLTPPAQGTLATSMNVGGTVSYIYTPVVGFNGDDTFTVQVSNSSGATAQLTFTSTVSIPSVVNTPPVLVSTVGNNRSEQGPIALLAIAGQNFEALFTSDDAETPQDVQVTILGTKPDGLEFTVSGPSRGTLRGIPTKIGDYSLTLTLDDSKKSTSRDISLKVVAPVLVNVPPPVIPVSGPANTVYASFLPGSSSNFEAVADLLASRPSSESRGFWWDEAEKAGRYGELPALPSVTTRPWHAVWLASVTPLSLPTEVPAVAMPFAIELAPGWTFFGIPPVTDGTTVSTVHGWANCSLETTVGVRLRADQREQVFGTAADSGGPWAWNGTSYARTTSLTTGSGYWLYNRSTVPVRLVRGSTAAETSFAAQAQAQAQAADNEQPPLPPHGSTVNRAESNRGGDCGTGSGMGLFSLAGLLALLRFRRR